MKFDPPKAERAAETLEHYATVFEARAAKYAREGKTVEAGGHAKSCAEHRAMAESVRALLAIVKVKVKRGQFVPPSLEEVLSYAKTIGFPKSEAEGWHDHFQSTGWRLASGNMMSDWKSAVRNGKRMWLAKNPGAARRETPKREDPDGWREFLKSIAQPYEPHDTAMSLFKDRFEEWRTNTK